MNRKAVGAALIIGMLLLGGCAANEQIAAPGSATPTATPSTRVTRTATPLPTATPPATRTVGFKCTIKTPGKNSWDSPIYSDATFPTLAQRWAATNVSHCDAVALTPGGYSTLEWNAVAAAGYKDVSSVKTLWEICARTDGPYQTNGPINDSQRAESNAALMLCPDHPSAATMANGSPEQQERAAGLRFGDGVREVGARIQPGTYRANGDIRNCYWERLDASGEIIDNNFVSAATQVEVTVQSSDYSLHTEGCGEFVKVG